MNRWRRSALAQDAVLAVVLAAAQVVAVVIADHAGEGHTPAIGLVVLAASCAPLVARRRWPVAACFLVGAVTAVYGHATWTDPPLYAAGLVAIYTVAVRCGRGALVAVSGLTAAGIVIGFVLDPAEHDLNDVLVPLLLSTAAVLVGISVASHRRAMVLLEERAAALERDREARARRAVAEERLRMARELHDATAHHVSVIAVQAEAAQGLLPTRVADAEGALGAIADSARSALVDLRRILGVLRHDGEAPLAPSPGHHDVAGLVEQVRAAGLEVRLRVDEGRTLPDGVDLSVYRIVQEALTNVLKHAGARTVEVAVRFTDAGVEVEVVDDGRGCHAAAGHGLTGMRERVERCGGQLEVGAPDAGTGTRVLALLPT